ncbi:MAG: PPC domain-containing protein [Deltaproteobacteria bacterium]|nr:PPC domain-containing protein [Deltaproteobacteria bacterium]
MRASPDRSSLKLWTMAGLLAALAAGPACSCGDDAPAVLCTTDAECRTGERCAPDGSCVFGAECVTDDECTAQDARTTCDLTTYQCQLRPGFGDECDASRPCPFGQFCSELLGLCLDASTAKDCVRRSQCPANQICDLSANKCIEDPGCYGDDFCEDGEICDLVNRVCRSLSLECTSCFATGACEGAQELCYVDTKECLVSGAEPECGTGEVCDPLGRCVQCTRSDDCGPGLFCNVSLGRCESNVQCADEPNLCPQSAEVTCVICEAPESCNPRTKRCEAPPEPCETDVDCPSDQLCDLSQDPPICIALIPDCLNDLFDTPRNDDVASASLLEGGPRFEELKACPGDQDWYRIEVAAGTYLTVDARFEHEVGDLDMELYLADGRTLVDQSRSVTDNERVELEAGTDLVVYARVFFAVPSIKPVPYEIIIARDPGTLCMDDGNEPDDGPADAKQLLSDQPYEGRLCSADPDWFVLRGVPAGTRVTLDLTFTDSLGDLDLEVYRAGQTQPMLTAASTNDDEALAFDAPFGGDFYVRVFGKAADTNVYTLRAALRPGMGNPCLDDRFESNDGPLTATSTNTVGAGGALDLTLCPGDEDWFFFHVNPGQSVEAELGFDAGADLELKIYPASITDPDVTPLEASTGVNPREYIGFRSFIGGDFLVRVHGHTVHDASPYQLRVRVESRPVCEPDALDAAGLGEDQATAAPMSLPPTRVDDLTLCPGDAADWFRVLAAAGYMNVIRVSSILDDGLLDFELRLNDGSLLFTTAGLAETIPREVQVNVPGFPGGYALIYVKVFATTGFDPHYRLTQDLVPIYSCFDDAAEPNNSRAAASLVLSSTVSPMIADLSLCAGTVNALTGAGDSDWFVLNPPAVGARIEAQLTFPQGDLLLELLSPNGGPRACINNGTDRCYSDGNGLSERIAFTATTTDPYILRVDSVYSSPNVQVRPADADTSYNLQVIYTEP